MRKSIIKAFTLLFVFVCLIPFNAKAVMTSLDISGNKQVYVNQMISLKATFNMSNDLYKNNQNNDNTVSNNTEDVTNKAVWTSSDKSIATVNEQGLVTGIKPGNVTINVSYNDVESSYDVEVIDSYSNSDIDDNSYDILTILTAVVCPSIAIIASIAIIIVERKNIKNSKNK